MTIEIVKTTSLPFEYERKYNKLANKRQKRNFFLDKLIDAMQEFIDLSEKMYSHKVFSVFEVLHDPIEDCKTKMEELVENGIESENFIPSLLEIENIIFNFKGSCIGLRNIDNDILIFG